MNLSISNSLLSDSGLYFFLLATCLFSLPAAAATDTLKTGDSINLLSSRRTNTLVSGNERFELGFFNPDGRRICWFLGIRYMNIQPLTFVWVANPVSPILTRSGGALIFLRNGSLVLQDGNGGTPFMAGNSIVGVSRTLTLKDSGNLVLTDDSSETLLWQSFEHPLDTFLPGMKMDGNMELNSWAPKCEGNSNRTGEYTFRVDDSNEGKRNISVVIKNKSSTNWKSPDLSYGSDQLFEPVRDLLLNNSAGYYESSRLVMNSTGNIQLWDMSTNPMTLIWSAPDPGNPCSIYQYCGQFASCNSENVLYPCRCLPGFNPTSSTSEDCSPSQPLEGSNDKFVKLKVKKVIENDTNFDNAKDESECQTECLSNRQCKAYAYRNSASSRSTKDDVNSNGECFIWNIDLTDMEESSNIADYDINVRVAATAIRLRSLQCENCGYNLIPYPLSTGENCGDPNYSNFTCNNSTSSGELLFTIANLTLPVIKIDEENRRFYLQLPTTDNCSNTMNYLQKQYPFSSVNCESLSSTLKSSSQIATVNIIWDPPPVPTCNSGQDCHDWPNSNCKNHRCICNPNYKWNGTSLICTKDGGDPNTTKLSKLNKIEVIIVVTVVSGILLLGLLSCLAYRRTISRRRKRESDERLERLYNTEKGVKDLMDTGEFNEEDKKGIDVPFLDLKMILEATNYFSDENKLGEGGFGPVYKGIFPGGQEMAVKRLSSKSVQGLEEFKNEVVLIAKLQHRNLVRLLGYCVKGDEKLLLYEYMKNRSLDAFIFDSTLCLTIDWNKRFEIIMGIARGLLYLHEDSRLRIIHRDLKTSNILLDDEMNPKISDFGLARIVRGSETEANTMRIVGTYGYMSPEYALEGLFSIKSDVFSFGVIVLEIISGRKNTGFYYSQQDVNLLGYAWNLWKEENIFSLLEQSLVESCNRGEVLRCVNVGLLCVQEDPGDRPTMSNVVFTLGNETATLPIPKQPAFVVKKWLRNDESSNSSKPEINSTSKLTNEFEEGR
ncbi:G-type lectin S-receptor-like serine/threonine-protein kinase At4g03230 isoform X2 [Impatiens glandulifera]|uniref:G-type lectin S-receptor-like serine/threonine-protein kinase At4g03230 isoform X2 n=1 Tax=Impatiens glandulifera TaxID=253017 RepID=UPI001FB12F77|nr:G-type lectin S-receptor-like serine/threonine-protein kinase At4g03230 isoform X2 [Impatiens glandulifera]